MFSQPKSQHKGPFFLFMLEFRRQEEIKGRIFSDGNEILQDAEASWKLLSKTERQAYKDQSMAYRNVQKQNINKTGHQLSKIKMDQRKQIKKQKLIDNAISEMIQAGIRKNLLEKLKMYFISVNHFCKDQSSGYVPAEIAIIKYTLENGILGKFHDLINPINLPLGLALEANQYSNETHALPIPPNALGETDFAVVLRKVLEFTGYNKPYKLFPIFTDAKEVAVVESVLTQLIKASKTNFQFLVISLAEFLFHLKRGTEKYGLDICIFPDKTLAELLLKNDEYEYTTGIACEYHEYIENPKFCALSKVCRWAYTISSTCCPDLSIDLIAGCHFPSDQEISQVEEFTPPETFLGQIDRMTMVSSEQSNLTPQRNQWGIASNPFCCRIRTDKNEKTDTSDKVIATTNSRYMAESVHGSNSQMKGVRHPKKIPVLQSNSGSGCAIKMDMNFNEPSSSGFPVKGTGKDRDERRIDVDIGTLLQGAGRGKSLFIGSTSIGTDKAYTARGRGTARRTSSIGRTPSFRRPYHLEA